MNDARPPEVIVTIAWFEVSHVAWPVTVCVVPSEKTAVAVNWTVSPTTGEPPPVTFTDVSETGVGPGGVVPPPPLLPQLATTTHSDNTAIERNQNIKEPLVSRGDAHFSIASVYSDHA